MTKGVIIELDFAVLNGAELLFETTKAFLENLDHIPFNRATEVMTFAGRNYLDGLTAHFKTVKTKKTSQKAARELPLKFQQTIESALPAAISVSFRNFIRSLTDAGVLVVLLTRANLDVEKVVAALSPLKGDLVKFYADASSLYGTTPWDTWRRICAENSLSRTNVCCVTGSGYGVKSALTGRMNAIAVVNDFVAHQDFTGAIDTVDALNSAVAKKLLKLLRV